MGSAGRILVIEDERTLAEAITTALAPGYEVRCALSGSEALAVLSERFFDLVLLDHRLPDLLGTDLLKRIKRFFPSTTVVFMTGHGSEEVAVEALRWGAMDYLRKPFNLHELVARVEAVFAIRRNGVERRCETYGHLLAEPSARDQPAPDTGRSRSLLRAVRHVEAHLEAPLPLDRVARLAGMSRFHFCRQFKRMTGHSFRAFVLWKRIGRAKELLRDGARPIGEVAVEVGFRDASHFGRVFRKIEHILPSEFRRRTLQATR